KGNFVLSSPFRGLGSTRLRGVLLLLFIALVSCQRETNMPLPVVTPAQTLIGVSYGSDPKQNMDLYLPAGRTDTTRLIILVHGGAWMGGDKSEMTQYVSILQQRLPGYAIANINYRLANALTNHFPTQETDMKAAVDFLVMKGSEYKISQKFVLLGASSGAHLALLQAYKYSSPKIKAVVDFFGPVNLTELYNNTTDPTSLMAFQILLGGTPATNQAMYLQSSPIEFVNAQSPPTIIFHGEDDILVPLEQSIELKNKLQLSGVTQQLVTYPNHGHDIWPAATINDAFDKIEVFIKDNE
ncbi:MAG TPA: prolyl oligopeptidase family serine peptidase, partial [Flavisolibacter sp.]